MSNAVAEYEKCFRTCVKKHGGKWGKGALDCVNEECYKKYRPHYNTPPKMKVKAELSDLFPSVPSSALKTGYKKGGSKKTRRSRNRRTRTRRSTR